MTPYQPPLFGGAAREPRGRRAPNGPPPDEAEIAARRILADLWITVQPIIGRAMTRTSWTARNKATALELARLGFTPDAVGEARRRISARMGSEVYSLRLVHDQLAREAATEATPSAKAREDLPQVTEAFLADLQ